MCRHPSLSQPQNVIYMIDETCYNFVERDESELYSVRLLKGEWLGLIYTYGRVSIKEDKWKKQATLAFDFKIEDTSECDHFKEDLEKSDRFKNYIGDVLAHILSQSDIHIGKIDGKEPTDDNH